ncbi:hypothetical protein [Streptomyces sp. NRRL B-1347]|uniref:hypothetical protein n=1 Tax=Streptomyces sp. NRRL B-1347 TaxID=1476877 RepID=UPI0004C931C1
MLAATDGSPAPAELERGQARGASVPVILRTASAVDSSRLRRARLARARRPFEEAADAHTQDLALRAHRERLPPVEDGPAPDAPAPHVRPAP